MTAAAEIRHSGIVMQMKYNKTIGGLLHGKLLMSQKLRKLKHDAVIRLVCLVKLQSVD